MISGDGVSFGFFLFIVRLFWGSLIGVVLRISSRSSLLLQIQVMSLVYCILLMLEIQVMPLVYCISLMLDVGRIE